MTLQQKIKVTIGDYVFDFVHDSEIESSYEDLTSTSSIQMPRKIYFKKNDGGGLNVIDSDLTKVIKRFDPVSINFENGKENELIFSGVVTKISTDFPVIISCEDDMFFLKQTKVKDKSFSKVSLKTLSEYLLENIRNNGDGKIKSLEIDLLTEISNLGSVRLINSISVAEILGFLKINHGVVSFIKDKKLVIGRPVNGKDLTPKFHYGFNVISQNGLEFWSESEVAIKMILKNINEKGEQKKVELGAENGSVITEFVYGDFSEKELEEQGIERLKRVRYTGYRGNFEAFLEPLVRSGDVIEYKDLVNNKPTGSYVCKKVNYRIGLNGFRQIITIGEEK